MAKNAFSMLFKDAELLMSTKWIKPRQCRSLAVLVESVVGQILIQQETPICLELDIDTMIEVPADAEKIVSLLESLVSQSLDEMPDGGDLTITAVESQDGLELELADTGCDVENRSRRLPMIAAAIGAGLSWQNCPQGGGAVTIRFPRKQQMLRAAA
ncbi:ATPase [Rhodopirellula sp.]|nr:ATPase [Rhodopirellula sp.]MDA9777684.1 ATPase [Rubripirellula sp.]